MTHELKIDSEYVGHRMIIIQSTPFLLSGMRRSRITISVVEDGREGLGILPRSCGKVAKS